MADENKEKEQVEEKETKQEKLSFKNADELSTFLMDLQGQIGNMQEAIDKLSPVDEKGKEIIIMKGIDQENENRSMMKTTYNDNRVDKSNELNDTMTLNEGSRDEYENTIHNLGGNQ